MQATQPAARCTCRGAPRCRRANRQARLATAPPSLPDRRDACWRLAGVRRSDRGTATPHVQAQRLLRWRQQARETGPWLSALTALSKLASERLDHAVLILVRKADR